MMREDDKPTRRSDLRRKGVSVVVGRHRLGVGAGGRHGKQVADLGVLGQPRPLGDEVTRLAVLADDADRHRLLVRLAVGSGYSTLKRCTMTVMSSVGA